MFFPLMKETLLNSYRLPVYGIKYRQKKVRVGKNVCLFQIGFPTC